MRQMIWLFGVLFFVAVIGWRGGVSVDHPAFNYRDLSSEEVILWPKLTPDINIGARYRDIASAPKSDVVLIGNHVLQAFSLETEGQNLDFRNFILGNPTLENQAFLLEKLEKHGKLPKKAIFVSVVSHSSRHLLYDTGFNFYLSGDLYAVEGSRKYSVAFDYVLGKIQKLWNFDRFVIGLAGEKAKFARLNYRDCFTSNLKGLPVDIVPRLRLKLSEYLPVTVSLATGLVDDDLVCRHTPHMSKVAHSYRRDGSLPGFPDEYIVKNNDFVILDNPYGYPRYDEQSVQEISGKIFMGLNKVAKIGARNGVPVIFIIPPRYQDPGDGNIDLPMNTAFNRARSINLVDHRKFWKNKGFYEDGTHLSPLYHDLLRRCLMAVLSIDKKEFDPFSFPAPECDLGSAGYVWTGYAPA